MNDRLLSFLGLCRRAGKMVIGYDPVVESIETDQALLVIAAQDISGNTLKKVRTVTERYPNVRFSVINRSKDELSYSLGKTCAVLGVIDKGFADKLTELISAEQKEGGITI